MTDWKTNQVLICVFFYFKHDLISNLYVNMWMWKLMHTLYAHFYEVITVCPVISMFIAAYIHTCKCLWSTFSLFPPQLISDRMQITRIERGYILNWKIKAKNWAGLTSSSSYQSELNWNSNKFIDKEVCIDWVWILDCSNIIIIIAYSSRPCDTSNLNRAYHKNGDSRLSGVYIPI